MKGVIPQAGTLRRQLYEQGLCDREKGQDQSTRNRTALDRGIHCDRKGAEDVGLDTGSGVQLGWGRWRIRCLLRALQGWEGSMVTKCRPSPVPSAALNAARGTSQQVRTMHVPQVRKPRLGGKVPGSIGKHPGLSSHSMTLTCTPTRTCAPAA